jgi:hypothetical protein
MNIQNLEQLLALAKSMESLQKTVGDACSPSSLFTPGSKYYIRTVTHHQVGKCIGVVHEGNIPFVLLENASWVADSGRWHDSLTKGFQSNAEIEPCPGVVRVNVSSIIDIFDWSHNLPTEQQ